MDGKAVATEKKPSEGAVPMGKGERIFFFPFFPFSHVRDFSVTSKKEFTLDPAYSQLV